jgi:hypothetical protein
MIHSIHISHQLLNFNDKKNNQHVLTYVYMQAAKKAAKKAAAAAKKAAAAAAAGTAPAQ